MNISLGKNQTEKESFRWKKTNSNTTHHKAKHSIFQPNRENNDGYYSKPQQHEILLSQTASSNGDHYK